MTKLGWGIAEVGEPLRCFFDLLLCKQSPPFWLQDIGFYSKVQPVAGELLFRP